MPSSKMPPPPSSYSGFSLVELSVVLAIIALMVGMTVSTGITQLDIAKLQGSKQSLEVIRQALNLFQKKYGRYPCPADPVLATSHANYGVEYSSGSCAGACPMGGLSCGTNAVIGMMPFKTIGLNEGVSYDAWDRRITYAVDKNHTATSDYANGALSVQDGSGNEITNSDVLGKAIFVLGSHGEDGNGGYTKKAALAKACGAAAKDIENCDYNDDIFVSPPFNNGDVAASFSDDLVAWQTQGNVNEEEEEEEDLELSPVMAYYHTCAIKASDTSVWCWGNGRYGRLGDNDTTAHTVNAPVQVMKITDGTARTGATQLTYSLEATCALIDDGTVWCWGRNDNYQIGDGTTTSRARAKQVAGVTAATNIASGDGTTDGFDAVTTSPNLYFWGWDAVAVATSTVWTDALQVDIGNSYEGYVKTDGSVWMSGNSNPSGNLGDGTNVGHAALEETVPAFTNATQLALTDFGASCALKSDGTVWCWGYGGSGAMGQVVVGDQWNPLSVGLSGITMVSGGGAITVTDPYFCAVKNDGKLYCWGDNVSGRLGNGNTTDKNVPTEITAITSVDKIIATGMNHMCVEKTDGEIWCWGEGSTGELGNDASADSLVPVQVQNFP